MGIYDRDYVRRDGPSFLGSIAERARVCKWLIGINAIVFLVQALTLPSGPFPDLRFTEAFDLNVDRVGHGEVWRLLTYAFLHDPGGIFHILFNMLFLWWFGSDVEDLYGPREFLTFYLSAALAGGLLFFFASLSWLPGPPCIGASGAVLAVLVLCAIHYPQRTILLFFLIPVPVWLFLVFFLAQDAYTFWTRQQTATAVAAHLGGALFAGAYYRLHIRLSEWLPPIWNRQFWRSRMLSWRRRFFGPRLRLYVDENAPRSHAERGSKRRTSSTAAHSQKEPSNEDDAAQPSPATDEHMEAKMDAILEKISRVGKENLSDSEREFLLRASEILRRRRS